MVDNRVKRILERVEKREITPEEGADLIESLEFEEYDDEDEIGTETGAEASEDGRGDLGTEIREELKEAAREIRRQARDIRAELKEELKDVKRDLDEAGQDLRSNGGVGGILKEVDSFFGGLGDVIRNSIGSSGTRGEEYRFKEVIEGRFTVEGPRLDLSGYNGNITLEAWDRPEYRLEVTRIGRGKTEEEVRQRVLEKIEVSNSEEGISTKFNKGMNSGLKLNLKAYLPLDRIYQASVNLYNGVLSCDGLRFDVLNAKMYNGKISLQRLKAEKMALNSYNGNMNIVETETDSLVVDMYNGKIDGSMTVGDLRTKMYNGNVNLDLCPARSGEYALKMYNGKVRLKLKEDPSLGYRLECDLARGAAPKGKFIDNLAVLERHGGTAGARVKFTGETEGFTEKPSRTEILVSAHNGKLDIDS